MKPRLLITGGSGLLALNWALAMRDSHAVVLGQHAREARLSGTEARRMSLDSVDAIVAILDELQPQMVVHTAGLTSVEKCEADETLARHVNAELAINMAKACARLHVPLIHISTDHLFSGDRALVDEGDQVEPRNAYARTKAEAEVRVMEACPSALIVRTNFYGWGPTYRQSFSDTIIRSLRAGKQLTLFQDVHYTPIIAAELARASHELLDLKVSGICNVVGDDRLSKYEFGLAVASVFALDPQLITPGVIVERTSLVQRPLDMSLSNKKVSALLGRALGGVVDHLVLLRAQEQTGLAKEFEEL